MTVAYECKDTLLKLENVCLSYDGRPVLKNVCAEVRDICIPGKVKGQVVGFLGPSGIGKTSLFRIIAGLNNPTSGQVLVADDAGTGFHAVRTGEVGVVAQNYPLFAHRTIMGNLMLPAVAHQGNKQAALDAVRRGLEIFELSDKSDLYPCQLSGGQRQRAAILQMLLCNERFILMDEPFSGLDLLMIEKTCETLAKAADLDERNTVIVVTHDVTAAVTIADSIWLLGRDRDDKGEIIPGARIVETYDLLARGLGYEPGLITSDSVFTDTVREIKQRFRTL